MVYAAGARQYQARRAGRPARLPDAFWIRLLWAVFALNIMLAITLLCVFVLHLAM
jgi:hypothetical protein